MRQENSISDWTKIAQQTQSMLSGILNLSAHQSLSQLAWRQQESLSWSEWLFSDVTVRCSLQQTCSRKWVSMNAVLNCMGSNQASLCEQTGKMEARSLAAHMAKWSLIPAGRAGEGQKGFLCTCSSTKYCGRCWGEYFVVLWFCFLSYIWAYSVLWWKGDLREHSLIHLLAVVR